MATQTEILSQALALSAEERAALADSLLESLDTDVDEDAPEQWRIETRKRMAELDSGSVETVAWDDVRARLRQSLK
jgi:putative addiction module component (TIGR02574 family)